MIGAWLAVGAAAGEGAAELLAGVRTAPDAAIEQPSEWVPGEVEPSVFSALVGRYRSVGDAWWGLDASAWANLPEGDVNLLALGPRAGIGADAGSARFDAAGRVDGQLYPWSPTATNVRAEALIRASVGGAIAEPELAVEAVDRRYVASEWSFRSVEPFIGLSLHTVDGTARARFVAGYQVDGGPGTGLGHQARGTIELGASSGSLDVWAAYRLIAAWGGEEELAERPVFTPIGDYSEDADALAAGGFVQHRVAAGVTAELGPWTLRGSALGRVRQTTGAAPIDGFARTVHGQLDVTRALGEHLFGLGAVGTSAAALVGDRSYVDGYGWIGVGWEL